jgi:hypothetical protein
MTTARPSASAMSIVSEIAMAHGYHANALLGPSRDPHICRARARAMKALRDDKQWSLARIGVLFGRTRATVWNTIASYKEREKSVSNLLIHPDLAHEVEAQMRRITGLNIAHQLAHELSVPTWQAIFLGILMEAYPLVKTADQIMEAYEAATERLYQADAPGAMDSQIRTFSYHIRKRFVDLGLPDPVTAVRPRGFVLTYDAAVWLHCKFGRPVSIGTRMSA